MCFDLEPIAYWTVGSCYWWQVTSVQKYSGHIAHHFVLSWAFERRSLPCWLLDVKSIAHDLVAAWDTGLTRNFTWDPSQDLFLRLQLLLASFFLEIVPWADAIFRSRRSAWWKCPVKIAWTLFIKAFQYIVSFTYFSIVDIVTWEYLRQVRIRTFLLSIEHDWLLYWPRSRVLSFLPGAFSLWTTRLNFRQVQPMPGLVLWLFHFLAFYPR